MDDNREYRLHHVVVGFCANLQLSCSMRLQQRVDAISLGCRQLLETSADLITMAADIPDLEAWMLSVTRGTGHSLEIVGAVLKSKSSDYEPVVLAPPTQYLHSRAARTDRMRGTSAFAFRAGRVPALFQVFRGPGCALYMCLRDGAPVPNIDETLAEYYLRLQGRSHARVLYDRLLSGRHVEVLRDIDSRPLSYLREYARRRERVRFDNRSRGRQRRRAVHQHGFAMRTAHLAPRHPQGVPGLPVLERRMLDGPVDVSVADEHGRKRDYAGRRSGVDTSRRVTRI